MKKIFNSQLNKKIISLVTAIVMIVASIPVADVSQKVGEIVNDIRAVAAYEQSTDTYTINSSEDLKSFASAYNANPDTYQEYTIIFPYSITMQDDFSKIGTAEKPFKGTIRIPNSSAMNISLNETLFAYIYDSVTIKGMDSEADTDKSVTLSAMTDMSGKPLFADNVVHDENATPANWLIDIEPYTIDETTSAHNFGGIIGTINSGANVKLDITNNNYYSDGNASENANVINSKNEGNTDVGLACGKMESGSVLNVTIDENSTNKDYTVSSTNGNAGGLVGLMESGATLNVNSNITTGTISATGTTAENKGYAGGVVGYATDATVNFNNSAKVTATVNGTSGTGGVFGYYKNTAENRKFDVSTYSIDCTLNGVNNGGLFGVLENSGSMTITDSSETKSSKINSQRKAENSGIYGGLIGTYSSDQTSRTLNVNGVTVEFTANQNASNYYGGIIGLINSACYVKISDTTVSETKKPQNFGGLVGESSLAFIDTENVTVTTGGTFTGGGIVGNMNSGVLHLSGTTDLSGARVQEKNGQIVGSRGQALIYATSGWKLIRSGTTNVGNADDIKTWGEVLRFDETKMVENQVLTEDSINHTVTVNSANPSDISSVTEFAKLALNIQLNNGSDVGTLCFGDTTNSTSSTLLSSTINLNTDIDLTGTGITGLTRDDGKSAAGSDNSNIVFQGTINGGGHKITLAIGECYGDRGTEGTQAQENEINNGRIYTHQYNGLFAKTGSGATFEKLTISGSINLYDNSTSIKAGGLTAVHNSGKITITSVNVEEEISLNGSGNNIYTIVGGMIGQVANNANPEISITGSNISPKINAGNDVYHPIYTGGAIGEITSTKTITVTIDGVTIGANITNNSTHENKKIGGLIAYIAYNNSNNSDNRSMTLKNVTVKDAEITAISDTKNSVYYDCGGLLGQDWNNVDVTIGDKADTSVQGIKVTSGTITNNGDGNFAGLVTRATGYWQVNDLKIGELTVNGSNAQSFGMIVNNGYNKDNEKTFALYLELTGENAYKINKEKFNATLKSDVIFDELLVSSTGAYTSSSDVTANGRAVVSIHTSDGILKMDGENCNTYQNQTSIKKVNPNTRYYYNLDVIRDKVEKYTATDSEKLLLWSVNQYAYANIKQYFTGHNFTPNTIPADNYDMTGLSYYPVDVDSTTTISDGANFKFYNSEIEGGENGTGNTDSTVRSTTSTENISQHYLMHCGLFRNVSGDLTVKGTTFSGNVGKVDTDYCGALVCGTISTDSTTPFSVTVSGVTLDGIKINGFTNETDYAPLLINKIVKNTKFKLSNVSNSENGYSDGTTVATSLIGDVGNTTDADNLKLTFSGITLDGRKNAISDSNANTKLTSVYHTDTSIFSKATLLNSFKYLTSKDCSAIYNYRHSEDWDSDGNALHKVTYGSEVSDSAEYNGKQEKYINSEIFTDPTNSNNTTGEFTFKTDFLPYVATGFSNDDNTHEIKVNHTNKASLKKGCGTYNDPYIIVSADQLELVAKLLNREEPTTDDTVINYTAENYKAWCNNKTSHTVYSWQEDGFYESTIDEEGTVTKTGEISFDINKIRTALSTAYYQLSADITLPDSFIGLGKRTAFKGVIYGKKSAEENYTITNGSSNPLIYQSIGSVVKDITVNVTAEKIELTSEGGKYYTDENGKTPFYGGIFGIVNGGDNIIDNVSVNIEKASTISPGSSSTNPGNVAVGGYVGVVRYGGVIFRNMSDATTPNFSENTKFGDVSDKNVYLYFNPIIGRVIDGYAFTETDHYTPCEADNPTMKNGTKNYSIADINTSAGKITFNDKTISVPDGQALFLMGCIAMSGAGSAKDSNSGYGNINNSEFSYTSNKMVRHGQYDNIGTNDDETNVDDFVNNVKSGDIDTNSKDTVPYIIYKYTQDSTTNTYSSSARSMTRIAFSIELTGTETYTLPDGFRGIGSLEKNSDDLQMKISSFDGKNCTVNLNMSYYTYEIGKDSTIKYDVYTDNTGKYGLGLFNSLINNLNNMDITISNLNISGNVISEIYKNENGDKAYGGNNYKDYKMLPVSGIIGGYKPDTKGNVTITNVNISGLDLKSNYIAGGLIGYVNGNRKEGTLSINNCQSNGSGISAKVGHYVGGMVGYVEDNITVNIIGDETNKSEFIINKINSIGDYASSDKWHDTFSAGGLIGYAYNNCTYNVKFMEVTGDTIESFGVCGGIVGRAMNGKTATIDNCVVKGIDLYGSFVGGITGITRITTEIKNCKVIGDTNKNKMIAYNSAGGIFSFSMEKDCTIDNCLVENYIIKLTGEKGIAYPENVGGFVGKIQYKNYKLTINNSKISDCNIQNQDGLVYKSGYDAGTGGVIGHCESGMKLYGYNILLNNVSLTDESGNELTSKAGYIAGCVEDVIKLVGLCKQNDEEDITTVNDFGTKSSTASAYVIYSDYDGKCNGESPNDKASTINATENVTDMEKSPYATINPKQQIDDTQFLTGDGVSKNAIAGIRSDTSKYKNVATADKTNVTDSHISTFKTETNLEIDDAKDFPVLKLTDADGGKAKDVVNSYIHLLTNDTTTSNYAIADSTKYNVSVSQYKYTDGSFTKTDDFETLKSDFTLTSGKYDNQNNQFTLLDVQYYAPGTKNIAYHLYIPVMVVKILDFDFKAAVLSGTNYKEGFYTEKFGNTSMENYGMPVTAYVTYSYKRTAQEWIDAVNSGEVITKGYGKTITLTPEDGVNNLPESTKITIVDRNNNNKAYYSTIGIAFDSSTKKLDFSKFTDSEDNKFNPVSFRTLLEKSGAVFDENDKITSFTGVENDSAVDVEENYYISFYTEQTETNMRNIKIGCSSRLGDEGMTPSHRTSVYSTDNPTGTSKYARMIFGNLYTQTFSFKTTTTNQAMSGDNNSVGANLNTTISLAEGTKNSTQTYLGDNTINLFHGFVIDATKTDKQGTEKGIKGQPGVNVSSFTIAGNNIKPTVNSNSSVITIYSGDKLIKEALKGTNGSVTIACTATLEYELSGIVEQFPEKAETENFGTTYEAYSNIAYADYNVESSSMSANKPDDNSYSYYRAAADIALTTLSYNVPSTTADEQTNLGVNGREKSEIITADGYYNVSELSSKSQAEKVKFTLKLYQKNAEGSYNEVNIGDYLKNISAENVTGVMSEDKSEVTFTGTLDTFKGDTEDTYTISTSYEVKTGKEFEDNSYFYANYKVVLTGELLDNEGNTIENSSANDHIIYTNAKIFTEFIQ